MKRIVISCLTVLISIFALQQSALAATITPNIFNDPAIADNDPNCSLRYAIESINTGTFVGTCQAHSTGDLSSDNVIMLPDGPYVLSVPNNNEDGNQTGDLDILVPMEIIGTSPLQTSISASGFPSDNLDRVIDIFLPTQATGPISLMVSITGVTIRDGNTVDISQVGGGIRTFMGSLLLNDDIIIENNAAFGGGINTNATVLTILNSQVLNNTAVPQGEGGGIFNNGIMLMDSCTVAGNTALVDGGGLFNGEQAVILNSTFSGNQLFFGQAAGPILDGFGGGIADDGDLLMINSTISGNTAVRGGGGIAEFCQFNCVGPPGFAIGLFNVTIARNSLTNPNGNGGGICSSCFDGFGAGDVIGAGEVFPVANTLIAENQAANGPDCQGDYNSQGFNLIGDVTDCQGFGVTGDQTGDTTNPIDPMITDLLPNGGPTETHGLLQGSKAIDLADPAGCMAPTIPDNALDLLNNGTGPDAELLRDQRNFPRPIDGDLDGTPRCDIGAFEFQVFDFELTKVDDTGGTAVPVGDTFNYIITVTNNGPGSASNVTLDDPVPANVDVISATPSQGACTAIGNVVGCDLGDLAVGESATITVNVIAVTEGTFTNVVTLTLDNPSQQTLTRTAQVDTTIVEGLFVFGSGIHCGLSPVAPNDATLKGLFLLALLSAAGLMSWRRRAR